MVVAGPHGDPDRIQPAPLGLIVTKVKKRRGQTKPRHGECRGVSVGDSCSGEVTQPYRGYHNLTDIATVEQHARQYLRLDIRKTARPMSGGEGGEAASAGIDVFDDFSSWARPLSSSAKPSSARHRLQRRIRSRTPAKSY
jgi:hypothetical protein